MRVPFRIVTRKAVLDRAGVGPVPERATSDVSETTNNVDHWPFVLANRHYTAGQQSRLGSAADFTGEVRAKQSCRAPN